MADPMTTDLIKRLEEAKREMNAAWANYCSWRRAVDNIERQMSDEFAALKAKDQS